MRVPKVSVLMTVFNAEAYLDETVCSIREQTFTDFEFVIINDGSTDGSASILNRHADKDERIKLFHLENQGRVAVLNYGLSVLSAPLVAIMDADDVALPDRLQKQWHRMSMDVGLGVLGGCVQLIDCDGKFIRTVEYPLDDASIRKCLEYSAPFAHPASMIRTDLLSKVGGYRTFYKHCEDFDLWLRLAEITRMANLDEVLLRYRMHGQNTVTVHKEALALGHWLAVACAQVRKAGLPDPTPNWQIAAPALFDRLPLPLPQRWRLKYEWAMKRLHELSVDEVSVGKSLMIELKGLFDDAANDEVTGRQCKQDWAYASLILARRAFSARCVSLFAWALERGFKYSSSQMCGQTIRLILERSGNALLRRKRRHGGDETAIG